MALTLQLNREWPFRLRGDLSLSGSRLSQGRVPFVSDIVPSQNAFIGFSCPTKGHLEWSGDILTWHDDDADLVLLSSTAHLGPLSSAGG